MPQRHSRPWPENSGYDLARAESTWSAVVQDGCTGRHRTRGFRYYDRDLGDLSAASVVGWQQGHIMPTFGQSGRRCRSSGYAQTPSRIQGVLVVIRRSRQLLSQRRSLFCAWRTSFSPLPVGNPYGPNPSSAASNGCDNPWRVIVLGAAGPMARSYCRNGCSHWIPLEATNTSSVFRSAHIFSRVSTGDRCFSGKRFPTGESTSFQA